LPEGESFVAGDCYHLVVKRQDDGVELPTCEICPSAQTPVDNIYFAESPSLVSTMFTSGEKVYFENFESGIVNIYTVAGQLLSSQKVYSGNMDVFVPTEAGVYILQMITKENLSVYKIKVK
jgi:hypothetical protein